ncbi:MAG TPA: hypothetical protein VD978_10310 [Azospirillum sp.]|nr:hypothetical protein [Azospirillum sp.]
MIDRHRIAAADLPARETEWLLYGCRSGAGEAGRALVEALFRQFLRWQQLHPEERAQRPEPPNR